MKDATVLQILALIARYIAFLCLVAFICSPNKGFSGLVQGVTQITVFWQIANFCEKTAK